MPEGEPHTLAQFCLDALDRPNACREYGHS
jgi:hypothetical protein